MHETAPETESDARGLQPVRGAAALLEVARRRAMPMSLAFGAVLLSAGLLAVLWPASHRATATLVMLPAQAGGEFAAESVGAAEERLQAAGERVLTATALLEIERRYELVGSAADAPAPAKRLERVHHAIRLAVVEPSGAGRHGSASTATGVPFTVSVDAPTASVADAVAADVVALFMRQQPEQPERFGNAQLQQEAQASAAALRTRAGELQNELDEARTELHSVQERLQALDKTARRSADAPELVRRLEEARSWLAMDREQRPPGDPAIAELEREVAQLEQQLRDARRRPDEAQRVALETRRDELRGRIEMLEQEAVQTATALREADVSEVRDAQAVTAEPSDRFILLEPPRVSRVPGLPQPVVIAILGLLLATAAAAAVAAWRERVDDRLHGARDLEALFHEAPLAVVPWLGRGGALDAQPRPVG